MTVADKMTHIFKHGRPFYNNRIWNSLRRTLIHLIEPVTLNALYNTHLTGTPGHLKGKLSICVPRGKRYQSL